VIDYKVYIGGIKIILVFDTVTNDFKDNIIMPEWVVKIIPLSSKYILCGLRTGLLIIVDIETRQIIS
jgi:hypothetical protein